MEPVVPPTTAYVKRCPQCGGDRPWGEEVCEGEYQGGSCGWLLSGERARIAGEQVETRETPAPASAATVTCRNGHPVNPGDQVCFQCGDDLSATGRAGEGETARVTELDGWLVVERLPSTTEPWERFIVERGTVRALLT